MKSLIVEDSRLLRAELKKLLEPHTHIQLCGEAANPRDALPLIHQERPDLLFLDINMPGKSGFDLLDALDYEPKVIFITAYSEYALRSFEFSTVDYLLKPLTAERLHKALEKLRALERCTENEKPEPLSATSRVLLRHGETCHWVCLQDIDYLESQDNQSLVIWSHGNALIYRVLTKIEERLPSAIFFRANRRQIVNIHKIKKVDPWFNGGYQLELQSGVEIEVSRRHATRFKDAFSL